MKIAESVSAMIFGGLEISISSPDKLALDYLKVKQWMQIEVTGYYRCNQGMKYTKELPKGEKLEAKGEKHDHEHVIGSPNNPNLQVDHGGSNDGFSKGPYWNDDNSKLNKWGDWPTTGRVLMKPAIMKLGKTHKHEGRLYYLVRVSMVQRFVSQIWLGQGPSEKNRYLAATVVWTSTWNASSPDFVPGPSRASILKVYEGGQPLDDPKWYVLGYDSKQEPLKELE